MKIYPALAAIMVDADCIGKDRKNTQQGYSFRGIDDVYNALHSIFAKHKVFCVPRVIDERSEERTTKSGSALIYRIIRMEFDMMADDGSKVTFGPIIGEGMDSGDKASNKAMSVAQKYLLLQALMIPTEEQKDPENDSHTLQPTNRPSYQPAAPQVPTVDQWKALDARKRVLLAKYKGMADEADLTKQMAFARATSYEKYESVIIAWEAAQ